MSQGAAPVAPRSPADAPREPAASRLLARVGAWWFAPAPAERLAALRILVGTWGSLYVAVRLPELAQMARMARVHFAPLGATRILHAPLPPALVLALGVATVALLALFATGVRFRVLGPLAAAAFIWTTTYRQSWGMIFHTDNLLALHLVALSLLPAADVWAWRTPPRPPAAAGYGWGVKLLVALTAAAYLLAGIAKLRIGGLAWIDGEVLRNHIAVDNVRKVLLGDRVAPFATVFLEHPAWFTVFSMMSMGLELGAPIMLAGGRVSRLWAYGAWGFHVGVVLLMNVWFIYPLTFAAFAPLFRVERPVGWLGARVNSRLARLLRP